jgi:hypothetical protein
MFNKTQEYASYKDFMNDRDKSEAITGYGEGGIFDIVTREYLGYWVHRTDNTVIVSFA